MSYIKYSKANWKILLGLGRGNQGDFDFMVGLQKYTIPAALYFPDHSIPHRAPQTSLSLVVFLDLVFIFCLFVLRTLFVRQRETKWINLSDTILAFAVRFYGGSELSKHLS